MKLSERDYSHLKGTEVLLIKRSGTYNAIVAGCDYNIGITIESIDDDGQHKLCLNAATHKVKCFNYNGVFAHMVAKVKSGEIDAAMPDKVLRCDTGYKGGGDSAYCAFL